MSNADIRGFVKVNLITIQPSWSDPYVILETLDGERVHREDVRYLTPTRGTRDRAIATEQAIERTITYATRYKLIIVNARRP